MKKQSKLIAVVAIVLIAIILGSQPGLIFPSAVAGTWVSPTSGEYSGLTCRDYGPFSTTFDGDTGTKIRFNAGTSGWCKWDYSTPIPVSGFKMMAAGDAINGLQPTKIELQVRNPDGTIGTTTVWDYVDNIDYRSNYWYHVGLIQSVWAAVVLEWQWNVIPNVVSVKVYMGAGACACIPAIYEAWIFKDNLWDVSVKTAPGDCKVELMYYHKTYPVRWEIINTSYSNELGNLVYHNLSTSIKYNIRVTKTNYNFKEITFDGQSSDGIITASLSNDIQLIVKTDPPGCTIAVQGKETRDSGDQGGWGYSVFYYPYGTYVVNVSKTGYDTQQQTVALNQAKEITFTLSPTVAVQTYTFTAYTYPLDATVKILEGSTTVETKTASDGIATFTLDKAKTYIAQVSKTGWTTKEETFKNVISERFVLDIHRLTMTINPPGAIVTIAGPAFPEYLQIGGVGTFTADASGKVDVALPKARYDITISKQGYITRTDYQYMDRDIAAGYTLSQTPGLPGGYTLTVFTNPKNCTVIVGSVTKHTDSGTVSFTNILGQNLVTVSAVGYKEQTKTINVSNDKYVSFSLQSQASTPGFEFMGIIAAMGIAFIIFRRKKQ